MFCYNPKIGEIALMSHGWANTYLDYLVMQEFKGCSVIILKTQLDDILEIYMWPVVK
jgi:hypothetical protein